MKAWWLQKCDPQAFVAAAKKAMGLTDLSNVTPLELTAEHRALFRKVATHGTQYDKAAMVMIVVYPSTAKGSPSAASLRFIALYRLLQKKKLLREEFLYEGEEPFFMAAAQAPYNMHQYEFASVEAFYKKLNQYQRKVARRALQERAAREARVRSEFSP